MIAEPLPCGPTWPSPSTSIPRGASFRAFEQDGGVVRRLTEDAAIAGIGAKARHIAWLIENGERVPETWVVPPGDGLDAVDPHVGPERFAVRSSANVEDGAESSYAGQFGTELDVPPSDVRAAIERVRESVGTERARVYRDRLGEDAPITMGVIVQEMVSPVVSGVAFSRNPMTGLAEVVIEGVEGRGDRLVDHGVTPERWVHRWGSWTVQPTAGALPETVAAAIAADTRRIADDRGVPVDLEWVWDGSSVWWVQMRPITGLDAVGIYSNRISREVMPGIIKPLVWSVNVPMVNRAWVRLFTEAIGPNDLEPERLARSFAYRSYFDMGAIGDIFELLGMPRDALELLLGLEGEEKPAFKPSLTTMRKLPRITALAARLSRYRKRVGDDVARLGEAFAAHATRDLTTGSDEELLGDIDALMELGVEAAYANIVTPLLANLYNTLLRRRLERASVDPESVAIADTADLIEVNPNPHLEGLAAEIADLPPETVDEIRRDGRIAAPAGLRARLDEFIERFGHLSSSGNDFSVPPWRETPDDVVRMAIDHASTHGAASRTPWSEAAASMSPPGRVVAAHLRRRTAEYVVHREQVSFTYTYGYGLFRSLFLEVARRLVQRGVLPEAEDIWYLELSEVRDALRATEPTAYAAIAAERKREIERVRDVVMPEIIYGDGFEPVTVEPGAKMLSGIPTSRGHHRGTLRVVRDTSDFASVEAGDVIAIPYSDVGWTPLFARAGAVVAAAGGMLSHSSIVAREYRIPCVVSVDGALQLPDGATVVVDGYAGTVVVDEAEGS